MPMVLVVRHLKKLVRPEPGSVYEQYRRSSVAVFLFRGKVEGKLERKLMVKTLDMW